MATFSATVTAKTGPAKQVTAVSITGLKSISIDIQREVIQLFTTAAGDNAPAKEFDLYGVTTITDTIAGGVHTLVIS